MRVLMISDVFFPRINGVSTSIQTFRRTLAAEGVQVTLLAPRYGDEPSEAQIVRVPGVRVPGDPEDRIVGWRAMRRAALEAVRHCDAVHIQTPFAAHYAGLAAARSAGVPVLATYHTLFEEYLHHYVPLLPSNWLRGLARHFSRAQCNALDAVIVPSAAMHERLLAYGVRAPIEILPTGIPLARFEGASAQRFRGAHGFSPTQPLLLFVGRVAHEKNIGFLFEVLQRVLRTHPRTILLVTGEGPALRDLRGRVASMRLENSVRFLGYLDRERELADCYAAANLFVFSSRTETQGLVLLEAMAAGTPVVGLSAMGTREILGPGLGCITPPDDVDEFARSVTRVLSDGALRAAMSEEARACARRWSDTAMATRLAQCYRSLSPARTQWKAPSRERPA